MSTNATGLVQKRRRPVVFCNGLSPLLATTWVVRFNSFDLCPSLEETVTIGPELWIAGWSPEANVGNLEEKVMRARIAGGGMDLWAVLAAAVATLLLIAATQMQAQSYALIQDSEGRSDGVTPYSEPTIDLAGNRYGTAAVGGFYGNDFAQLSLSPDGASRSRVFGIAALRPPQKDVLQEGATGFCSSVNLCNIVTQVTEETYFEQTRRSGTGHSRSSSTQDCCP
jgi:hypothetical protein